MDKYYVFDNGECVAHRPPLKVFVNDILRFLQQRTNRPWLIASKTSYVDNVPHFDGYTFQQVEMRRISNERTMVLGCFSSRSV